MGSPGMLSPQQEDDRFRPVRHRPLQRSARASLDHQSLGIDPTVFIDDDGQAYLYSGNSNLWYVKLNEDTEET
jgi:hypothetical protein